MDKTFGTLVLGTFVGCKDLESTYETDVVQILN